MLFQCVYKLSPFLRYFLFDLNVILQVHPYLLALLLSAYLNFLSILSIFFISFPNPSIINIIFWLKIDGEIKQNKEYLQEKIKNASKLEIFNLI